LDFFNNACHGPSNGVLKKFAAMFKPILISIFLISFANHPSAAQELIDRKNIDHQKISANYDKLKKAADAGSAEAQYKLGSFYFYGKPCFKEDYAKALIWLTKAARQGHLDAMNHAAWTHQYIYGATNRAHALWKRAASRGYGKSMFNIARGFEKGWWEGKPDIALAIKWFVRAGNNGYPGSFNEIGNMYSSGRGVPKNPRIAVEYYRKAAESGGGPAQYNLGLAYELGRGVTQNYSRAAQLYLLAAKQGYYWPMYRLARLYQLGKGIEKSDGHAALWYRRSAMHGYAPAQYAYGKLLETGRGTIRSKLLAAQQFDKAARQGHFGAKISLNEIKVRNPAIKLPKQYSTESRPCIS